jgi:hypothetical protein
MAASTSSFSRVAMSDPSLPASTARLNMARNCGFSSSQRAVLESMDRLIVGYVEDAIAAEPGHSMGEEVVAGLSSAAR